MNYSSTTWAESGRNGAAAVKRIAVSSAFMEKRTLARKCISDLTSRDSASGGERSCSRTIKFRPREQNNKFILAVDGGEESGMQSPWLGYYPRGRL